MQRIPLNCAAFEAVERIQWAIDNGVEITCMGLDANETLVLLVMDIDCYGPEAPTMQTLEMSDDDAVLWMLRYNEQPVKSRGAYDMLPPDGQRFYDSMVSLIEDDRKDEAATLIKSEHDDLEESMGKPAWDRVEIPRRWGDPETGRQALKELKERLEQDT